MVFNWDKKKLFLWITTVSVIFAIAVIIGYFGRAGSENVYNPFENKFQDKKFVADALEKINSENIRNFLKILTKESHVAASYRDKWLTSWIERKWTEFGFTEVTQSPYTLLLSYPDEEKPNKIYLYNEYNQQVWVSRHMEQVLRPEDEEISQVPAFNAFSPQGDVTGELVYVNFGRKRDLRELEQQGVNITGKIAIVRYGRVFRGNKIKNCEEAGAIGVILYSDPQQVAKEGVEPENVYPNKPFLPESGIQRGSLFSGGDPLSPGWASVKGAYRLNTSQQLPGIPCQPIGYGDAERLLELMGGELVPEKWEGRIPGLVYRLGPGFNSSHKNWKVRLVVNNILRDAEDSNVIGVIRGKEEPDRYVIIGNHRDAWGTGSVDPSSGTSALMEVARVFGSLLKNGWRPRRTIVFASWAAEEYSLMGSTEYVFENLDKITHRAVAYLNQDLCVFGKTLTMEASPVLKNVFLDAMKTVADPTDKERSLYDYFMTRMKPGGYVKDKVKNLGSGTDHAPFVFYAGVPSVNFAFTNDNAEAYPLYHSGYETFHLIDKLIDPGFKYHRACSQLLTHMAMNLGESSVLPFSLSNLFTELRKGIKKLEQNNVTNIIREMGGGPAYDRMMNQLNSFEISAGLWSEHRKGLINRAPDYISDIRLRALNNQAMLLDRIFILPEGLPGRATDRHALFSPSKRNVYGSSVFPGLLDLTDDFGKLTDQEKVSRGEELKIHLSDLMTMFMRGEKWLIRSHRI